MLDSAVLVWIRRCMLSMLVCKSIPSTPLPIMTQLQLSTIQRNQAGGGSVEAPPPTGPSKLLLPSSPDVYLSQFPQWALHRIPMERLGADLSPVATKSEHVELLGAHS